MKMPISHSHKPYQRKNAQGNAMIYVLIALALFGFLTIAISRQNDQADGQDLSDEQALLYANELIEYTTAAQYAIEMMLSTGSKISDLDFILPSDAAFNTGSNIHKLFHPQGGGMNYQENFNPAILNPTGTGGWFIKKTTNIEWTPSTATDIMLSTLHMNASVCKAYNKKITGTEDIPQMPSNLSEWFLATSTRDLLIADCPACEGYPTLCVQSSGGISHGIYAILAAQ